jgi:hypothetical protein
VREERVAGEQRGCGAESSRKGTRGSPRAPVPSELAAYKCCCHRLHQGKVTSVAASGRKSLLGMTFVPYLGLKAT